MWAAKHMNLVWISNFEQGVLRDDDGQAYNEAWQRLDDHRIVILEDQVVDDPNAQLAAHCSTERSPFGNVIHVDRHNTDVDLHERIPRLNNKIVLHLSLGEDFAHTLTNIKLSIINIKASLCWC